MSSNGDPHRGGKCRRGMPEYSLHQGEDEIPSSEVGFAGAQADTWVEGQARDQCQLIPPRRNGEAS